jgi:hypothetical protein
MLSVCSTRPSRANQQIRVQPSLEKYPAFTLAKINSISPAVSSHRGAARDRHGRGAGRGGRATASARNRGRRAVLQACEQLTACRRTGVLRTAKSFGPDAPTLASSFAETPHARPGVTRQYPQSNGGKKARSPGSGAVRREGDKSCLRTTNIVIARQRVGANGSRECALDDRLQRAIQYSEAAAMESRGLGVLDTPHARGMTAVGGRSLKTEIVEIDCVPTRDALILAP